MKDLQVIENSFIDKMLASRVYLRKFPFLKQYAEILKHNQGCGTCGGSKAAKKAMDYTEIKRILASMPADRQAVLLALTEAKAVRIAFRNRLGQIEKVTITAS